jgi:hypothetical protein
MEVLKMEAITVNNPAKHAMDNNAHQGGNKAAPRPGFNKGTVDHHMEDRIDHGAQSVKVKAAMAEHGHHNVEYYHGGRM